MNNHETDLPGPAFCVGLTIAAGLLLLLAGIGLWTVAGWVAP